MKVYFHFFLFGVIFFAACNFSKRINNTVEYNAVEFISRLQYVNLEALAIEKFDDSVIVFYGENGSRIFKLPYAKVSFTSEKTDSGLVFSEVDEPPVVGYKYFYIKSNQKFGKLFSDSLILLNDNVPADSIYERTIAFPRRIINSTNVVLTKSKDNPPILEEYYFAKFKPDETYADSIYLFYDASLKRIPFSFSDSLDLYKNSKLHEITYIYNSTYNQELKVQIPKRQIQFQIRPFNKVDSLVHIIFSRER